MKRILLALVTLSLSPLASAEVKGLVCGGTEPFYSLDISATEGKMTYHAPENLDGTTYSVTGPIEAAGMPDAVVMVFRGSSDDVSATVISDSVAGSCSDGMSDNVYSYHLVYTNGSTVKYGCCEPKAQH